MCLLICVHRIDTFDAPNWQFCKKCDAVKGRRLICNCTFAKNALAVKDAYVNVCEAGEAGVAGAEPAKPAKPAKPAEPAKPAGRKNSKGTPREPEEL